MLANYIMQKIAIRSQRERVDLETTESLGAQELVFSSQGREINSASFSTLSTT
jgi:hypothetical protein